jgi:2-oxoglutarate dehydrogenase E2 component (dihydrolipoamide succinyltransferase)
MRKSIAEHMVRSVATAPHVTAVFDADLSAVLRHREAHGKQYTLTAYFVRASVAALEAVPEVNSRWRDEGLELFEDCNIGIGTALPGGGLIVPVLPRAQTLDLAGTAGRLAELTERARAGKLVPAEVQGGTFTISNHGVSGSLLAAPIVINQPQSAILGVGKLEQRVRVAPDGGFVARPMVYVTLTIDHRALDGFQANAFLTRWVEVIEQWT